jgi:hypothetical protein
VARNPNASPYLFVADALITDHSSIGFEFMLLDRPVVVIDCPGLIEKARVSPDKVRLLRSSADVVAGADELVLAVTRALEHPSRLSERRRAGAGDLFYEPGAQRRAPSGVCTMYSSCGCPSKASKRGQASPEYTPHPDVETIH